ncbi:hypothetical protein MMC07_007344 [Pseudocyphellaria aurata]|nr:hypothetical protein [Pseudocyphellaria aurata]
MDSRRVLDSAPSQPTSAAGGKYASLRPARKTNESDKQIPPIFRERGAEYISRDGNDRVETTNAQGKGKKRLPAAPTPDCIPLIILRPSEASYEWYDAIHAHAKCDHKLLCEAMFLINRTKSETKKHERDRLVMMLRTVVHKLEVSHDLSGVVIKASGIVENGGLPDIFESKDACYPNELRMDCFALWVNLQSGHLDNDLLRGIKIEQNAGGKRKYSLDPEWPHRVSCDYHGEGPLVVGQWWPFQICSRRDGGHGSLNGGIYGQRGDGAYSVLLGSRSTKFQDVDKGDVIEYCGAMGKNGDPSWSTQLLRESFEKKFAVRVFRSYRLPRANVYRPSEGVRYDGLYRLVSARRLPKMYVFSLERMEGQWPMRWYGVEARPSREQLLDLENVRKYQLDLITSHQGH